MFALYQSSSSGSLQSEEEKEQKPSVPHNRSHRFEDANDDDSAAFLRVTEDTKQVDFYKNPTILSRLLLNHKYGSAIKRVRSNPEEAKVWVAMRRNPFKREKNMRTYLRKDRSDFSFQGSVRSISSSNKNFYNVTKEQRDTMVDYSMRQLPIHTACCNLIRPTKPEEQSQLEKLIALLVVTYPEGCEKRDHDGKLPLHEAIWHNASSETISMMLMASPRSLHERDKFGRSPHDLNRIRSGGDKDKVKELLIKGVTFWETARARALANMKGDVEADSVDSIDGDSTSTATSRQSSLRPDPTGNLNPVVRDISRQMKYTAEGKPSDASTLTQSTRDDDDNFSVVEPISFVKLEQRAVYLEQLLAGMYEKNYELGETVEELTRERLDLQEELANLRTYGSNCTDESLQEENGRLRQEVAGLARALAETGDNGKKTARSFNGESTESQGSYTSATKESDQIQYLQEQNANLEEEVDELSGKIQQYESQVNRLEIIIAAMNRPDDRQDEVSVDDPLASIPEETSPGRPSDQKVQSSRALPDSKQVSAEDDLDSLYESLSTNSRYATERYLAGKILLLEDRLDEEMTAREADVRANNHENRRLLMENEALQSELNRMSRRNLKSERSLKANGIPRRGLGMAKSSKSTFSDYSMMESLGEESEFEALLNEAFHLYGKKQSSDPLISASSSKTDSDTENPIVQIRDEVERIEDEYGKPVPLEVKMSLVSAVSSLSLGTKLSDGDEEDLDAFLEEAAKFYGKPIPSDLRAAMQGTSLVSLSTKHIIVPTQQPDVDDDLGKMFEEAGRLYQNPIPAEVRDAVRDVVTSGSGRSGSNDAVPMANLSPQTNSSYDPEEELLSILSEAEQAYGKPLPADMKHALLTASISSGISLRSRDSSKDGKAHKTSGALAQSQSQNEEETDDIEKLFIETEKIYQKPIPSGMKSAVRNAALPAQNSATSLATDAELECIIRDAERAYGRALPADLKLALVTASVSSGLSLRSLGDSSLHVTSMLGDEDDDETAEEGDELDFMFKEAAILYREPIPFGVQTVVRDAVASSSKLVVSDSASQTSDPATASEVEEELECIIRDAERAYGKSLPEDLKHALMTASISSGLSFRSMDEQPAPAEEESHVTTTSTGQASSPDVGDDLNEMFADAARRYSSRSGTQFSAPSTQTDVSDVTTPAILVQSATNERSRNPSFASDNLEDIFASAAKTFDKGGEPRSSAKSVGSGSTATETNTYLPKNLSVKKPHGKPSAATSYTEDDLESILREAEASYGMALPEDLKYAVRSASLKSGLSFRTNDLLGDSFRDAGTLNSDPSQRLDEEDDDLERMFQQAPYKVFHKGPVLTPTDAAEDECLEEMFEEAARIYDKPIPPELMNAMREAVTPGDLRDASSSESEGHEPRSSAKPVGSGSAETEANTYLPQNLSERKPRGKPSTSTSKADDDLESILREAEAAYGMPLPEALKLAVRSASLKSGLSFRTNDLIGESFRDNGMLNSDPSQTLDEEDDLERMFQQAPYKVFHKGPVLTPIEIAEDDYLEKMFEEAARIYDKPIPPELMDAMREAVTPADLRDDSSSESDEHDDSSESSGSSYGDDLESIIREAEETQGASISAELRNALLDGESFRTRDFTEASSSQKHGQAPRNLSQSEEFLQAAKAYSQSILDSAPTKTPSSGLPSDDLDEMCATAAKAHSQRGKLAAHRPASALSKRNSATSEMTFGDKSQDSAAWISGSTETDDINAMLQQYSDRLNKGESR